MPVLAREELTSNVYDDIQFQRVIIEEMGELLPAKLLAECDLSRARSVLEIGCGTGEWLRAVARQYPDLQYIGIDQNELQVKAANALAYRDGLAQVAFLAHAINDLPPTLFPEASFDLVHLSFLSRYILTVDYPSLARMCAALCRPGGMVCWTEAELPITTSAAFERLTSLVCEALQRAGQSFIPQRMWEWSKLVAARSGKTGVETSTYKRRHLGITSMLGGWLRDAGCGAPPETPLYGIRGIDERVIHETAYAIEVSAGKPANAAFVGQVMRFAQQVKPFLLRTGMVGEMEHAALCDRLATEMTNREFCGLSFLLRAWAPRP
ncbi:MAG: class I SAM-dependent methyltransferase [Ktedonobacteraceae bacterium]